MSDLSERLIKWTKEGAITGLIVNGAITGLLLLDTDGQGFIREAGVPQYLAGSALIEAIVTSAYMTAKTVVYYGDIAKENVLRRINNR